MKDFSKYQGIIPAFYACYDAEGAISPKAVRELTQYFIDKGVKASMWAAPPASVSTRARKSGRWSWKM